MTDAPPASAPPVTPIFPDIDVLNVVVVGVAAFTATASLVALYLKVPYIEVAAVAGPVTTMCATIYQRRSA